MTTRGSTLWILLVWPRTGSNLTEEAIAEEQRRAGGGSHALRLGFPHGWPQLGFIPMASAKNKTRTQTPDRPEMSRIGALPRPLGFPNTATDMHGTEHRPSQAFHRRATPTPSECLARHPTHAPSPQSITVKKPVDQRPPTLPSNCCHSLLTLSDASLVFELGL
mmetsp:Transcript_48344/g.79646  ORF Transcript_48344/g.79646 Transcript_48344/m.79646 type:complete len:164 (+) Transcript_48344:640-1131(+)